MLKCTRLSTEDKAPNLELKILDLQLDLVEENTQSSNEK